MSNNLHIKKHKLRDNHSKKPTTNSQISCKSEYKSNYQTSETIIKLLIDKIISQSVRKALVENIDNQINSYCFNYLQNQFNILLEENYLSYTTFFPQTQIFYKTPFQEKNKWVEIKEPKTINDDRCEGNFIIFKELKNEKKILSSQMIRRADRNRSSKRYKTMKIYDFNLEKKIHQLLNSSKSNKKNNFPVIEEARNENDEKDIKSNKKITKHNNNLLNLNINNKNDGSQGKKKKLVILDLPSFDIPEIKKFCNHDYFDPPNISNLRKERELLIIKKIKENQEKIKNQKKDILKKKEELDKINRKLKPFDFNKLTFDSNGKIIRFKQFNLDSLNKDFLSTKNIIKENDNKLKQKNKKSKKLTGNIVEEILHNPEGFDQNLFFPKPEKILPSGSNFNIFLPNVGVVIKENQNIKEGSMEFNKYFQKYSISDYDKMLNDFIPIQNKNRIKISLKKGSSNSISLKKNVNSLSDDLINLNINNNSNRNTINATSNNNPLLSSADNININSNKNNNSNDFLLKMNNSNPFLRTLSSNIKNNSNNTNPLMTSYNNIKNSYDYINSNLYKSTNFNNSITMSKIGVKSVKSEIDNLKELNKEDGISNYNFNSEKNIKTRNFFKSSFRSTQKILLKKEIKNSFWEDFNKKIIADKKWGEDLSGGNRKKPNNVFAKHHTRSQALRELGSSIFNNIKVKLPRNRKVELNI